MHLTDTDLIRFVDREGDAAEREIWSHHLHGCEACAERLAGMEENSRMLTAWLERAAFEAPKPAANGATRAWADLEESPVDIGDDAGHGWHRAGGTGGLRRIEGPPETRRVPASTRHSPGTARGTPTSAWLRAAVIVLLLAAPLAAIPPVREWVVTRVALLGSTSPPPPSTMEAAAPPTGATIRFAPAPGPFTIQVESQGAGSALTLDRASGDEAVLQAAATAAPESVDVPETTPDAGSGVAMAAAPVVSAGMLRLPAASAAMRYQLRLPASVTAVVVRLDGRTVRVTSQELDDGVTLDL